MDRTPKLQDWITVAFIVGLSALMVTFLPS